MTAIVIAMIVILAIAAAVVVYVAYPHRGADLPVVPQLGAAVSKAVEALPTVAPVETIDHADAIRMEELAGGEAPVEAYAGRHSDRG